MTSHDDVLQYAGPKTKVYFVRRSDGSVPARKFYEGKLRRKLKVQTDFEAIMKRLGDRGVLTNTEKFRHLDRGVWEMKSHEGPGWRLYCVYGDSEERVRQLFVSHGRKKPNDNRVQAEIDRALEIFADRRRC